MRPRQTDSDRDPLEAQAMPDLIIGDIRARRLRRARSGTLMSEPEAALVSSVRQSSDQADRWRGPKLTKVQREALVTAIALHEDSPAETIREVFRELCEDEPPAIADRTIRYYKAHIRSDLAAQAEAARDLALVTGLALKASRVAELRRQFLKLTRLEASEQATPSRVMLSREKREILRQIALELGQLPSGASIMVGAVAVANAEAQVEIEDEQARQELALFLEGIIEREVAAALALAGAQRPSDRAPSD